MIVQKAYKEDRLAYRAYRGDKIIWDCSKYTSGVAQAAMLGFSMAQTETPLDIQMWASANAILSALARTRTVFKGELKATGTMEAKANPESVTPADVELHGSAVMRGFAMGYTYGQVFTSGVASGKMQGIAYADLADAVPTMGTLAAKLTGTARADPFEMLNLLFPSSGEGIGTANAKPQAPMPVKLAATGAMTGSGCAINLPIHTVTFNVNGETKHQEKVIHGYACPDPVETGKMDKPTKEMTVSHTYEYDSWEAEAETTEILPTTSYSFAYNSGFGVYSYSDLSPKFSLTEEQDYTVTWDGNEHTRTAFAFTSADGSECVGVGNPLAAGQESNDDLFCVVYDKTHNYVQYLSLEQTGTHTVAVYQVESGGGSTAGDPLSCITQDIVVHPTFTEHIRYYTVRFFDDGELVDTDSVPYGGTAVTDYMREGFNQVEWFPSNENITGDTDCHGKFTKVSFADATWDEIAEIAASGNASSFFSLGEEKTIDINYAGGTTEPLTFVVAGFDNGILEDRSPGRLVLAAYHALKNKRAVQPTYVNNYVYYHNSNIDTWLNNDLYNALPAELQNVIKSKYIGYSDPAYSWVTDSVIASQSRKCWLLSLEELGLSKTNFSCWGAALPLFTSNASRIRKLGPSGTATSYLTRNYQSPSSNGNTYFAYITTAGAVYGGYTTLTTTHGVVFGIVI